MHDALTRLIANNEEILEHLDNARLLRAGAEAFVKDAGPLPLDQLASARAGFLGGALFVIRAITMTESEEVLDCARQSLLREAKEIADVVRPQVLHGRGEQEDNSPRPDALQD